MIFLTIFTPTFNREQLLSRCYESLKAQSSKNFTWLIIDDGSTDNTSRLVKKWIKEKIIDIEYKYVNNGGKHIAHNEAVKLSKTPFFLILDSDDVLSVDAVAKLSASTKMIKNNNSIAGVIGNRFMINTENSQGVQIPKTLVTTTGNELFQKYGVKGDTLRLYKTAILKSHLFPVINNEKFLYENIVFDKIEDKYSLLVSHDALYYGDYMQDGYTVNSSRIKRENPIGYAMSLASSANYSVNTKKKLNWTLLYIIWTKKMHVKNAFANFRNKPLYILLLIPAYILILFKQPSFFFKIMVDEAR